MREYTYSKLRTFSLLILIYVLLLAMVAFLLILGQHILFMISIPVAGAIAIPITYFRLDKKKAYKIVLGDEVMTVALPYKGDRVEIALRWDEITKIAYEDKRLFTVSASVASKRKKAVFPLSAFGDYKTLLKSIIRKSCDNDGFYTDQKILDLLRN